MYLKFIWVLNYILPQKIMTIYNMVEKSTVNLKHLPKEMIDTSFTNWANNMDKMIYLISLLLTLLQIARDGLVIFYKEMVEMFTWIIKSVKKHLPTILGLIAYGLVMTLFGIIFVLMMVSFAIMDNIHDFYVYLFKKERLSRPSLCLTKSYRLVRIGIKKLPRKLYGLKSHLRLPD